MVDETVFGGVVFGFERAEEGLLCAEDLFVCMYVLLCVCML
jgi:hypothetical protein